jgi:hypothetical protein
MPPPPSGRFPSGFPSVQRPAGFSVALAPKSRGSAKYINIEIYFLAITRNHSCFSLDIYKTKFPFAFKENFFCSKFFILKMKTPNAFPTVGQYINPKRNFYRLLTGKIKVTRLTSHFVLIPFALNYN